MKILRVIVLALSLALVMNGCSIHIGYSDDKKTETASEK